MNWLKHWLCDHSWIHHWLPMPDGGIELMTCGKCGKSKMLKMVKKYE